MRFSAASRGGVVLPIVLALLAADADAQAVPQISAKVVSTDMYPRQRTSFPGGVTGRSDLTYPSWLGYRPLKLDLYLPPDSANARGRRPFVVYVHGGGWMGGTPQWKRTSRRRRPPSPLVCRGWSPGTAYPTSARTRGGRPAPSWDVGRSRATPTSSGRPA